MFDSCGIKSITQFFCSANVNETGENPNNQDLRVDAVSSKNRSETSSLWSSSKPSEHSDISVHAPSVAEELKAVSESDGAESEDDCHSTSAFSDIGHFSSAKYESRFPWLYNSESKGWFSCKYCVLFSPLSEPSLSQAFVGKGAVLRTHPSFVGKGAILRTHPS